jgi:pimeloyl-ACP methyl ester carboxylesterase
MAETSTRTIDLDPDSPGRSVEVALSEAGAGRTVLVLHGGGGPATVQPIVAHLSGAMQVLTPVHPGWDGTARPGWLSAIGDLAAVYLRLLRDEGRRDVLVIGSSIGGWIGAEMAARDDAGLIAGLVLIDSVGVLVDGEPIRDFFALDARGVAEYSFHDAERFYVDPATIPPEQAAQRAANMATMRVFAGDPYMHDPGLRDRLGQVEIPVLVLWGDSDRIVTPGYGQALAAMFPQAEFAVVNQAGHLPQLEQPAATFGALDAFVSKTVSG